MQSFSRFALAAALSVATLSAQAALEARPGGMVYDTVQKITWLQNWNTNGLMDWTTADAWANNLVYGGFSDWRLPTLNPSDTTCSGNFNAGGSFGLQYFGTGCTGGELSRLFVTDLGNKASESVLNTTGDTAEQIANLALFSNVQSDRYWSGTEYAPNPVGAWVFLADLGNQSFDSKINVRHAVAVRPGDVAAIPEPQTYALLLAGLGAVAVAVRRRRPV